MLSLPGMLFPNLSTQKASVCPFSFISEATLSSAMPSVIHQPAYMSLFVCSCCICNVTPPVKQLNYWFTSFYLIVLVQLDCVFLEERGHIGGSIWIMNEWTQETLKPVTFKVNKFFSLFCMYICVYLCVCNFKY